MHGQVKTDKSAAVKEREKKQKDAKLKIYREGMAQILERRRMNANDWETMACVSDVLAVNGDVYTLWNIRKEVLLHMIKENLIDEPDRVAQSELRLTELCLKINPKSYVAWHHRCWIVENFPQVDLKVELGLCNKYLKLDARNFHCWDYRRFITTKLDISPEDELAYTMQKIEEDFSNYSSWHYRSKLLPLIHSDPAEIRPITEEVHLQELDLVQNAAFTDPNDQSAWFYLRWLLGRLEPKLELSLAFICGETKKLYLGFNRDASNNGNEVNINVGQDCSTWSTVTGTRDAALWIADILGELSDELIVSVTIDGKTEDIVLKEAHNFFWCKNPQFDPDVSPKLKAVLTDQLKSCNQLLELEPESKWPLLTSVVFMKAVDRIDFKDEIILRLRSLMNFDKYRSSYYSDTMSKFAVEDALKSNILSNDSFSFAGLGLTSLYHIQYLSRTKKLILSQNLLQRSLSKLIYAVSCEELLLDDNELTSLKDLPVLPKLKYISLAGNKFEDTESVIVCLDRLPSLQKINVGSNPLVGDDSAVQCFKDKVHSLHPSVEITFE